MSTNMPEAPVYSPFSPDTEAPIYKPFSPAISNSPDLENNLIEKQNKKLKMLIIIFIVLIVFVILIVIITIKAIKSNDEELEEDDTFQIKCIYKTIFRKQTVKLLSDEFNISDLEFIVSIKGNIFKNITEYEFEEYGENEVIFYFDSKLNLDYIFMNIRDYLISVSMISSHNSEIISMRSSFEFCTSLKNLTIKGFTVSNDMSRMLFYCNHLKSVEFSDFNTNSVTNMSYMFFACESLRSLDLSSFNTSLVTNMNFMFHDCHSLFSLDLSNFNTSLVTTMENMFWVLSNFEKFGYISF